MGNGIAIPVSVLFLLILFSSIPFLKIGATAAAGAACLVAFFFLTRDAGSIGDASLKTTHNLVVFFSSR